MTTTRSNRELLLLGLLMAAGMFGGCAESESHDAGHDHSSHEDGDAGHDESGQDESGHDGHDEHEGHGDDHK